MHICIHLRNSHISIQLKRVVSI